MNENIDTHTHTHTHTHPSALSELNCVVCRKGYHIKPLHISLMTFIVAVDDIIYCSSVLHLNACQLAMAPNCILPLSYLCFFVFVSLLAKLLQLQSHSTNIRVCVSNIRPIEDALLLVLSLSLSLSLTFQSFL